MAIRQRNKLNRKPEIDISGPDGNAFALMGNARVYAKQLGKTPDQISALMDEMMSADYENLISVFDREFGNYVDLIR